jgi:hypothetical protein
VFLSVVLCVAVTSVRGAGSVLYRVDGVCAAIYCLIDEILL